MAVTLRARRTRYDNIAAGSATGNEFLVAGETVSRIEMHGGGVRTSTSNAEAWQTNVQAGVSTSEQGQGAAVGGEMPENIVVVATTGTDERPASNA